MVSRQNAVAVKGPNCLFLFALFCRQFLSCLKMAASGSVPMALDVSSCRCLSPHVTLGRIFRFLLKMAGTPLKLVVENGNVPLRTARRWCEQGRIYGAYKRRGRWYLRRLPPRDIEIIIKMNCATILRKL